MIFRTIKSIIILFIIFLNSNTKAEQVYCDQYQSLIGRMNILLNVSLSDNDIISLNDVVTEIELPLRLAGINVITETNFNKLLNEIKTHYDSVYFLGNWYHRELKLNVIVGIISSPENNIYIYEISFCVEEKVVLWDDIFNATMDMDSTFLLSTYWENLKVYTACVWKKAEFGAVDKNKARSGLKESLKEKTETLLNDYLKANPKK